MTEAAAFVVDNGIADITPGTSGETLHIDKDATLNHGGTTETVKLGAPRSRLNAKAAANCFAAA